MPHSQVILRLNGISLSCHLIEAVCDVITQDFVADCMNELRRRPCTCHVHSNLPWCDKTSNNHNITHSPNLHHRSTQSTQTAWVRGTDHTELHPNRPRQPNHSILISSARRLHPVICQAVPRPFRQFPDPEPSPGLCPGPSRHSGLCLLPARGFGSRHYRALPQYRAWQLRLHHATRAICDNGTDPKLELEL